MIGSKKGLFAALVGVVFGAVYQFMPVLSPEPETRFDVESFGKLPVLYSGRYKPIDTVARNSLLIMNGRQSLTDGDTTLDAGAWMLELAAKPDVASERKMFRIDHPGVLAVLDLAHSPAKRFSFNEAVKNGEELSRQLSLASSTPQGDRNLYQRKLMSLGDQLGLFQNLSQMFTLAVVPSSEEGGAWTTLYDQHDHGRTENQEQIAHVYMLLLQSYRSDDAAGFNTELAKLHRLLEAESPDIVLRANRENTLNNLELFPRTAVLYVIVSLLMIISWLKWGPTLLSASTGLVLFALVMHTVGLTARVYLSGRPPVTNLYSSAVFIGWGTALIGIFLEYLHRNGMGVTIAAVIGFLSLLIAQGLSGTGDTMAVLQAVLDTNFWLATHVIVITLGYAATYLAGFLGIAYVFRGVFTKSLSKEDSKRLGQMIYGVVCFATVLSFLGTILGGIWADQSWGRFWGWDPKENGALIIVLWNALILHARWGGMVRARGLAVLAVFGNIVTSWSWFGVNMLGRGLHSYGFMDSAAFWLISFVAVQLLIVAIGMMPANAWRSRPWERTA